MERIANKIGRIKEYLSLIRSIQDDCLKIDLSQITFIAGHCSITSI